MNYHGFGYIVDSCPVNETEHRAAARRLKCGVDQYRNSQYVCAPNAQRTAIVEYCYRGTVGLQNPGTCLKVYSDGSYDAVSCTNFKKGCTTDYFTSADLYKYPACHQINTQGRCYYEDPTCQNMETTVFSNETFTSTPRNLSNITDTTFNSTMNTAIQSDDNVLKAILTGSFAGILVLFLAIFLFWLVRSRKRNTDRKNRQNRGEMSSEQERFINTDSDSRRRTSTIEMSSEQERFINTDSDSRCRTSTRGKDVLGDYSVWKTPLSDQFPFLSDYEVCVLFCFLCSDSGTPDFTDTDGLYIFNEILHMCGKYSVTSEEAQWTLGSPKLRGFLWDQDGGDMTEDAKDETIYYITDRCVILDYVYCLLSYTTAVRYLRSQGYTRKSGEKCVITDDPDCDSLLILRLQMNILTHVTMEDTDICDKVSQILNVPTTISQDMTIDQRQEFIRDLEHDGECVHYRGGPQGSVQHVKWLWRYGNSARPDIVRSCIGLHPHNDIYIINNTAYRKYSKYHEYPDNVRSRLYCLLLAEQQTVNVKDHSHQDVLRRIRERYFKELALSDDVHMRNLPDDIIQTQDDVITFKSDDIRHNVMYAFVTECLVEDSDLKFFLTTASSDVISEYCRLWNYKRSEGERCLYIPNSPDEMYELFIDRLQLDILTHCTMSDSGIHDSINKCLGVPREILSWDREARERYVEYAKRGTQTVHHARGMIVGCAGAGKTTLLKRLLRCSDTEIRGVTSTEGLEVHEEIFQICEQTKTLKANTTPGGGEEMRDTAGQKTLSMFDFGGQCAYYACHQIYLTGRAFYMVVVDASKLLDQVVDKEVCDQMGTVFSGWTYKDYFVFWIKSIHTYCGTETEDEPDPEVIIVATHWDKNVYQDKQDSLVTSLQHVFPSHSTLAAKYIRDDNFFLTKFSQESPLDILSDLEKYILDIVCQKRWAEDIPKEWTFMEIEIRKKKSTKRIENIEKISKKMPNNETIRNDIPIAIKLGIHFVFNDMPMEFQKAVQDMLRYYHDAGKILYFNETALQELIIIDVQWFVDAFKNIITDKLHRKGIEASMDEWDEYYQTGHIKDSLLTEIWRKKDRDLHKELLEEGRTAIGNDVSKDPQYLLPHKDEILMFMNRLGLIAVGEESHYVPCMNRQ